MMNDGDRRPEHLCDEEIGVCRLDFSGLMEEDK